ncbi:MAG: ROK family protein, partial [Planctomycetes bacterium]|nr:ROK family protein [Planctomycetota bacterium]
AVLADLNGDLRASVALRSGNGKDIHAGKREILEAIAELRRKAGDDWSRVLGIGFSDPGIVDINAGVALRAVNIDGWRDVELRRWLGEVTGLDSVIYPAMSARAYIEYLSLGAERPRSLFLLELATGIGGGLVHNGEIFTGDSSCAMEVGHIVVQPDGPLCHCGNRGCLEALIGSAGIARRVRELLDNGVRTELRRENFSIAFFVRCVQEQDKVACALALEACEYVGAALATVLSILNPSMIVLTGPLAMLGDFLTTTIERVLPLRCMPAALNGLNVRVSTLPQEATALGAAMLMREKAMLR